MSGFKTYLSVTPYSSRTPHQTNCGGHHGSLAARRRRGGDWSNVSPNRLWCISVVSIATSTSTATQLLQDQARTTCSCQWPSFMGLQLLPASSPWCWPRSQGIEKGVLFVFNLIWILCTCVLVVFVEARVGVTGVVSLPKWVLGTKLGSFDVLWITEPSF